MIVERQNREAAFNAIMIQLAVSSIVSKKGSQAFKKRIEQLNGK